MIVEGKHSKLVHRNTVVTTQYIIYIYDVVALIPRKAE